MTQIGELIKKIIAFRNARNWRQFHKPKDLAISLLLEAAEVAEHFQWKNDDEIKSHLEKHRANLGEELADVLYWVLLMSHDFKIDIHKALEKKLRINEKKYPVAKAKNRHEKYTEL